MLKLTKCSNITFNMQHFWGPLQWDLLIWGSIASKQFENLCFKIIAKFGPYNRRLASFLGENKNK